MTARTFAWPASVGQVSGMAPGELRLIHKASGSPLDQLDTEDQVKAAVFVALVRVWRDAHNGELPDPGEAWERAEWTVIQPETPTLDPGPAAG